ncbi:MAG: hypothetical protein J7527_16185, partial [Chitinophagaceae bacterium]|nr:hypothetical protein [Chitinophagaceae bacterium]
LFGGSWLYRWLGEKEIEPHQQYSVAKIIRRLWTVKNGEQFEYTFTVGGEQQTGYRSSHIDYKVQKGDYFLVRYSSRTPSINKLLYEHKWRDTALAAELLNTAWDTIPVNLLQHRK